MFIFKKGCRGKVIDGNYEKTKVFSPTSYDITISTPEDFDPNRSGICISK